ncbi:YjbH domain-containing protein [Tabrizicola sp.]|uniref:YjbH domain-containing protein n=1 Tax=Tabrizicola sp. TaxID=2005166 RepID=UPI002620C625|nr:YjbH domain-containing protein [Tabrizicola sp.]MDM7931631.1 YjbH domain-containing protein [Tabrizicola sp.]
MPHLPSRLLASLVVSAALCGGPALAEMTKSLNINGTTGLIDMPSGDAQDDAAFTFSTAFVGPISRATISFQITDRLSGSFRFQTWRDWDTLFPGDSSKFNNRSFDIRYQLLKEGRYLPSLTVGLIDFTGQSVFASEYVAATKTFGDRVKVTAGLGWGRLGSYGSIGEPFGDRPLLDGDDRGTPNVDQWFRGDAAPFAGVEVKLTDTWTFKGEYSSDAYVLEDDERGLIERDSPFNFGFEYQRGPNTRYGIYSMHGTEVGFVLHLVLDPKNRATGGVMGAAPVALKARPSRTADPDAYDGGWVVQPDAGPLLRKNLAKRLAVDGIIIENLAYTAKTVQVRIRNNRIDAGSQAIGRTARALSHVMPASVEVFEIVPVVKGIGASKVTIRRSDLEALEYAPDNANLLRQRVTITDAGPVPANAVGDDGLYPKFRWGLRPDFRMSEPLKGDLGLRLSASYDFRPGLVLSGSIYGRVVGNVDRSGNPSDSVLQPVRSDSSRYSKFGSPGLERLTLAWFARPAPDLYSRVSFGYLERMHAGISGEVLWKPVESRLALGAELNYTKQRDTDGLLGFDEYDYDVVTGHVSAYYDFGNGFLGQLDVGKYLAGDVGATISVDRVFVNGWRVGAYATVTDVSAADFGTGGFDKGVRFSIPLNWAMGTQSNNTFGTTLRSSTGDGGARLDVDGRLYNSIRDYHSGALDPEWGRVWR